MSVSTAVMCFSTMTATGANIIISLLIIESRYTANNWDDFLCLYCVFTEEMKAAFWWSCDIVWYISLGRGEEVLYTITL